MARSTGLDRFSPVFCAHGRAPVPYRWGLDDFLLAWEAGAFSKRTELIDGEVWEVPNDFWHAETTGKVIRALPNHRFRVVAGTLPAGQSLPEPDCWVLRGDAQPIEELSPRMSRWAAPDVVLVVEVSDETRDYDLTRKAVLYADAGFSTYWPVAREGIYVHSDPGPGGYSRRLLVAAGGHVTVPYASDTRIAVSDLLAPQP